MKLRSRPTRPSSKTAASSEEMQVAEEPLVVPAAASTLQESNAASIVSPCKVTATEKSNRKAASVFASDVRDIPHKLSPGNEFPREDDTFDVLDVMATPKSATNQRRESLIQQSPGELMLFSEPGFTTNPILDPNSLSVHPTSTLLEFDYNMDFLESFSTSSKDGEGTPLRRGHSLDLSSPPTHDYKRYKQSHSLPNYEDGHLNNAPLPSFGSNTSDLTPIPVGVKADVTPPVQTNSSPMMMGHPPRIGAFHTPPRMVLNPKATVTKRGLTGLTYSDVKRKKLTLPPQLIPDDKEGRRMVVIRGSTRQYCEDGVVFNKAEQPVAMAKQLDVRTPTVNRHFTFLKSIYPALEGLTFLLPGLKNRIDPRRRFNVPGMEIRVSSFGSFKLGHEHFPDENGPTVADLNVAKRRIDCAICAFGGTVKRKGIAETIAQDRSSIFRTTKAANDYPKKKGRKANAIKKSRRPKNQYYDNGKRLSWEVEADISFEKPEVAENTEKKECRKLENAPSTLSRASSMNSESSKRYKCKLCGLPKQNHVCPFRQTVLRSIGVMAYPSANAFSADEPGKVAPSLCEMNNFVLLGSQSFDISRSFSYDAPTVKISQNALTSAFERRGIVIDTAKPSKRTNKTMMCKYRQNEPNTAPDRIIVEKTTNKKDSALLFQPTMEITQEQYRMVSPTVSVSTKRAPYSYPPVPMSYSQRESMSDKLFQLSKKIPGLAKECKTVLDVTRANGGDWDLAVAELMTQVVCVVCCCPTNDFVLDGLSSYLLQLGISC